MQSSLSALGLNIRRFDPTHDLGRLLKLYGVEAVFDVGANIGMSGRYLRNLGFRGPIVSFEPTSAFFRRLEAEAAGDPLWRCRQMALGDRESEMTINVSGDGGGATSLLTQLPELTRRAPQLGVVSSERVRVGTVDGEAREHYPEGDRLFLKLDVQGYERQVIEGARATLPRIVGMRVEMSLIQCYEGEPLLGEMLAYLNGLGFRLCGIEEAWSDPVSAEVFQVDGVFFRPEMASPTPRG